MKIACTDTTAATQVELILESHGIVNGIVRTGPSNTDPTIWIIVKASDDDAGLRLAIESIPGAIIQGESDAALGG